MSVVTAFISGYLFHWVILNVAKAWMCLFNMCSVNMTKQFDWQQHRQCHSVFQMSLYAIYKSSVHASVYHHIPQNCSYYCWYNADIKVTVPLLQKRLLNSHFLYLFFFKFMILMCHLSVELSFCSVFTFGLSDISTGEMAPVSLELLLESERWVSSLYKQVISWGIMRSDLDTHLSYIHLVVSDVFLVDKWQNTAWDSLERWLENSHRLDDLHADNTLWLICKPLMDRRPYWKRYNNILSQLYKRQPDVFIYFK